jgi:polyribonucleotide nucleotidyltransferase
MLHYDFPGFSTGEVKPNRALAAKSVTATALRSLCCRPMMGTLHRIVSDILESGSSSMARCAPARWR